MATLDLEMVKQMISAQVSAQAAVEAEKLVAVENQVVAQKAIIVTLEAQLRRQEAARENATISRDLIELARDKRETELLEKEMMSILPSHRSIQSYSPQGFSGVKTEYLSQVKAMAWVTTETKLHRIKVALNELERLKVETDAAIAAAEDAAAKAAAATQHRGR